MKTYICIPIVIIPLLIMTLTTQSSSTLTIITVQTSKQSYDIYESIEVYGYLAFNGVPVSDNPVAIEVQNPSGDPVVMRSAQTDSYGAYNLVFKLSLDAKLGMYTVYVSSSYKGETATDNTRFQLIQITQTTVTIEGEDYTITIESNSTITSVTATRTQLKFTSSGSTGQTAYVSITIPTGLNKTQIKVFIDNTELIPPPYPTITTNSTHYFIYFEFALSTHNIAIEYAIADIATTNIRPAKTIIGQGYTIRINTTIQNQGDFTETFNVTVYANTTSITSQKVTLTSGNSTTIIFTWNTSGFVKGNYTIWAYAWPLQDETDIFDNNCTGGRIAVTIPGDVDGNFEVDIYDVTAICVCYDSKIGPPRDPMYYPNCDLDGNGIIDIYDVTAACITYGQKYP